jgi:cell division septum initiation protein DivIVA
MKKSMSHQDLREQIARLEADVEQLAQTLDRCRKAMLVAKVVIAAGTIWVLASLVGVIRFDSAAIVGAIATVIGGVVIYGSNSSTSKEAVAAMDEGRRTAKNRANRQDQSSDSGWQPTSWMILAHYDRASLG